MISYLVAFSFSGTKWNLLLTLSFFCWHECPRSLAQNSRKAPLWKRFSLARSMALSVGLLFLWKAVLLKDAYSLTGWITLWNMTTKKKQRETQCIFFCLFLNTKMLPFSYAGFLMTCHPMVTPFSLNSLVPPHFPSLSDKGWPAGQSVWGFHTIHRGYVAVAITVALGRFSPLKLRENMCLVACLVSKHSN